MSERPISVGDLVQVVRHAPCCGIKSQFHGELFVVNRLREISNKCNLCGNVSVRYVAYQSIDPKDGRWWAYPLPMLKRIPPLSELEGKRTEEKLKEKV